MRKQKHQRAVGCGSGPPDVDTPADDRTWFVRLVTNEKDRPLQQMQIPQHPHVATDLLVCLWPAQHHRVCLKVADSIRLGRGHRTPVDITNNLCPIENVGMGGCQLFVVLTIECFALFDTINNLTIKQVHKSDQTS